MSRNISDLHPELQLKIQQLKELCSKNGITIGISECLRTVAEQDALYAKGRTAPGNIVTNAKGSTYSSMHQWGIAFDFYLIMDVDKDGKTSDDSYNNTTGLFNKVGALGKSIGLEWGGDWKSIKDLPHFQLKGYGSTASMLKSLYRTPEAFKKTWNISKPIETTSNVNNVKNEASGTSKQYNKNAVVPARSKSNAISGKYKTGANLNLRMGPGTNNAIIVTMPKYSDVRCYGYFTEINNVRWYLIEYGKYTGYCSSEYLSK